MPPSASCNSVTNLVVSSPKDFSNLELESPGVSMVIIPMVVDDACEMASQIFKFATNATCFGQPNLSAIVMVYV